MPSAIEAASGRWPELLGALAHLTPEQLTDKHQPCPACGGEDRYRWDRDDGPGGWYCNQCGGKNHAGGAGSGMDLLTRVTGWSFADACRRIEQHLGIDSKPQRPDPPTAGAEHVWRYTDTFYVCRFPGKKIRPLTFVAGAWSWKSPPKPRPLYWARRVPGQPILIAEGEKAADAAAKLFPEHSVLTWPGGTSNVQHADWKPLEGAAVTIWPDADDVGRKAASQLAAILLRLRCSVVVVDPPDHVTQGWDLADGLAAKWTPAIAAESAAKRGRVHDPLPDAETAAQLGAIEPSQPAQPEAPPARGHSKPVRMENHEILRFLPDRLGGQPRLNIRTRDVHLPDGVITADDAARLYLTLSNEYEKWPKEPTFDAVQHIATAGSFDPVADYLTGLEGSTEPLPDEEWRRLDLLLFNIDDPVAAAFLPRFFISAVARTFQPGCFGRQWPVMIGDKGIGKSDLPKLLFNVPGLPEGFIDNPGDLQREGQMKAHRSWCVELAELNGISRRADKEHLKAFLSERSDTFRTPWSRAPASHPRRFVFWGTSNGPPMNEADPRFVCIPLPDRMLPFAAVEAAKDALWARAVADYRAGVCWHTITEEFKAVLRERNEDHTVTDPWADQVANYLARREQARELPVNVPELMDLLKLDSSQRNNAVANRLIELASSMGWFKGRRRPAPGIEQRRGLWPKGWS